MVLADGGVACIDEFDKMRPEDRVAIHEAMEQQTISIAKAGIATVLNSRVAVLAAANPPSGRYDELLTAEENVDLQNSILSRFDLIFLIRDEKIENRDMMIAHHICSLHRDLTSNYSLENKEKDNENENFLKRYITFARNNCQPLMTKKAETILIEQYVYYRKLRREQILEKETKRFENNQEFKDESFLIITVRQLEALLRISEAIARMTLSREVTEIHVEQAVQIFNISMSQAKSTGITGEFFDTETNKNELTRVIFTIRKLVSINKVKRYDQLEYELIDRCSVNLNVIRKALSIMLKIGEIIHLKERKAFKRLYTSRDLEKYT